LKILTDSQALRWRPTTPGALPYVLTQNGTFEGYTFLEGTALTTDAWTIGHDEASQYSRCAEGA